MLPRTQARYGALLQFSEQTRSARKMGNTYKSGCALKRCHMKGNVRFLNLQNGLVAVETSEGFTVLELLECCAIDLGDEITGPLDSSGTETLYNISKEEHFEVSIENIHCTRVEACKLLAD